MIESVNNERVKYYQKLNDKKYRQKEKLFIAPGTHLVEEAIKKNIVKEIFLLNGEENIYDNQKVTFVTSEILKKVANLTNYPKVLAICNFMEKRKIEGNILVLDDISDPGNLGTIIRSAVAFNYQTIIASPRTVDVYNLKTIRSSEGMIFHLNYIVSPLIDTLKSLKDDGYMIYGTDVNAGISPSKEDKKHIVIIGSEARGMNTELKGLCDKFINLKMNNDCESLNAGVSASIIMYELGGNK